MCGVALSLRGGRCGSASAGRCNMCRIGTDTDTTEGALGVGRRDGGTRERERKSGGRLVHTHKTWHNVGRSAAARTVMQFCGLMQFGGLIQFGLRALGLTRQWTQTTMDVSCDTCPAYADS